MLTREQAKTCMCRESILSVPFLRRLMIGKPFHNLSCYGNCHANECPRWVDEYVDGMPCPNTTHCSFYKKAPSRCTNCRYRYGRCGI